jgi:hypothetical protein
MNINQLKESKFLKKEDAGAGILVTISHVTQENVAKEGADQELKWVIHFKETDKPMVLNSTNGQLIASILKSEETDSWAGHKIVLYHDPNVSFGGKLMGGIRVRAPRNRNVASVPAPAPAQPPLAARPAPPAPAAAPCDENGEVGDDSVPF